MEPKLRNEIFIKGMTQKELAAKAGIPKTYISWIITGRLIPTDKERYKIAKALNVKEGDIFNGD